MKRFIAILAFIAFAASGGFTLGCSGSGTSTSDHPKEGEVGLEQFDASLLPNNYLGNLSGMIGAAELFISTTNTPMLVWGRGSVLHYGTIQTELGSAELPSPGTITAIAYSDEGEIVFGTDQGVGFAAFDDSGKFKVEKYHKLDSGISMAESVSSDSIYLVDAEGNLLSTNIAQLNSSSNIDIIKKPSSWSDDMNMYPVDIAAGGSNVAVILQPGGPIPAFATDYEPLDIVLAELLLNVPLREIRLLGSSDPIIISSTSPRSGFIPTGIDIDGNSLIVAGLAYNPEQAEIFTTTKCLNASDLLACLREHAKIGGMTDFTSDDGEVFTGRVVKIDLGTREVVATKEIIMSRFIHTPSPAFIMSPASAGGTLYLRGSSFLMILSESENGWATEHEFGRVVGEIAFGWTRSVVANIESGAVAVVIQPETTHTPAYSALEYINTDAERSLLDSASIDPKVVSGAAGMIAIVERRFNTGGDLHLCNLNQKYNIVPESTQPWHIINAAYEGERLAFVWTTEDTHDFGLRLAVQNGTTTSTRKEKFIPRGPASLGFFADFPAVENEDSLTARDQKQGIADMKWHGGKLYLLAHGFKDGTHYFKAARFGINSGMPSQENSSILTSVDGSENFSAAKILKIDGDTVYFSAPDGIYSVLLDETTPAVREVLIRALAAIAVRGDNAAAIDDTKIRIVSLDGTAAPRYKSFSGSTSEASVAYLSSKIIVSLPNGSTPLLILNPDTLAKESSYSKIQTVVSLPSFSTQAIFIDSMGSVDLFNF